MELPSGLELPWPLSAWRASGAALGIAGRPAPPSSWRRWLMSEPTRAQRARCRDCRRHRECARTAPIGKRRPLRLAQGTAEQHGDYGAVAQPLGGRSASASGSGFGVSAAHQGANRRHRNGHNLPASPVFRRCHSNHRDRRCGRGPCESAACERMGQMCRSFWNPFTRMAPRTASARGPSVSRTPLSP
jgi:hypothetical protein